MSRPLRALAGLFGTAALTLVSISPASAAYWRHDDAVGDVVSQTITFDDETGGGEEGEMTVRPGNTDTDITRLAVNHRANRVVLRTALRDITGRSGFAVYEVRTAAWNYAVIQRLGKDRTSPKLMLTRANGDRVRCRGVVHEVRRDVNRAIVKIPRRCMGRPGWVRVGAGVAKFDETDTSFTILVDDALKDAKVVDRLGMSPRVPHS